MGDALQILYDKHGIKREDLYLQTKWALSACDSASNLEC